MQNKTIRVLLLLTVVLLTGCSVVEGIFKAGMGGYFYSNRNISDNPLYC
jgi:ABC-type dipeptide/oligopeptide/nickel transport system permease component